jgi:hypothetical protein
MPQSSPSWDPALAHNDHLDIGEAADRHPQPTRGADDLVVGEPAEPRPLERSLKIGPFHAFFNTLLGTGWSPAPGVVCVANRPASTRDPRPAPQSFLENLSIADKALY